MPRDWEVSAHVEDRAELRRFRRELTKRRVEMGWDPKDLAQALAGLNFKPETGSLAWTVLDVQQWCKALGGSLSITYPELKVEADETDEMLSDMAGIWDQDTMHRFAVQHILGQARIQAGLDLFEFAKRIDVKSSSAVRSMEMGDRNPIIFSLMRSARALGSSTKLALIEAPLEKGPQGRKK